MDLLKKHWRYFAFVWIAFVFVQSLFFKFTGSNETQYIFGTIGAWLGMDWFTAYGGYIVGSVELVASILLFTRFWAWGAVVAFEVMAGAIVFHLFTPLGIPMPVFDDAGQIIGSDGGTLFVMACFTISCAAALVVSDWLAEDSQIRRFLKRTPTTAA